MPKAVKSLPSQAYLHECFDYDPETGRLSWRRRPPEHFPAGARIHAIWNTRFAGKEVTSVNRKGYLRARLGGDSLFVARIAFKMVHGYDPVRIDHKNRQNTDNRIDNLRDATVRQNNQNMRKALPKSGFTNVFRVKSRYGARIRNAEGKRLHLGYFDTPEDAYAAYCHASLLYHGEFGVMSAPVHCSE